MIVLLESGKDRFVLLGSGRGKSEDGLLKAGGNDLPLEETDGNGLPLEKEGGDGLPLEVGVASVPAEVMDSGLVSSWLFVMYPATQSVSKFLVISVTTFALMW